MGALKRKQEHEAITFKLPAALKREIEALRTRAEDAGFDLGETITAAMWRLCKQIKAELEGSPRGRSRERPRSGADAVNFADDFCAAGRRAEKGDSEVCGASGKGRWVVEQDKGPAVRHGIFD